MVELYGIGLGTQWLTKVRPQYLAYGKIRISHVYNWLRTSMRAPSVLSFKTAVDDRLSPGTKNMLICN